MDISVFGMGYVGAVTGACLAEMGHRVIGVDVDPFKVETINNGHSPIVEELIGGLIAQTVAAGAFRATTSAAEAVAASTMSIVCVGTPSTPGGGLDTKYVQRVCEEIGAALAKKSEYHLVVIRSTVLPGAVENIAAPALEKHAGRPLGDAIGLCFHPEFLREGSSVNDFRRPPKIVIGANDDRAADTLAALYTGFEAPLFKTAIRAAEMVKYADNAFHALKVVFGNEIGALCKALDIDSHEVMRIFCQDRKLNISPAYLMPGFAYGGSCLPKDLRALNHLARENHLDLPLLANVRASNDAHLLRTLDIVLEAGARDIAMLGLSFKAGTDDLRESPLVELAERLLGKGCRIRIHDENVQIARLLGGNKAYIEQKLPHIGELLEADLDAALQDAQLVIAGAKNPAYAKALAANPNGKIIVDLVRLFDAPPEGCAAYRGLCW